MKHFYKIAYSTGREEAIAAHQQRFGAITATRLPLSIRPIEQEQIFTLYYLPTNEMIKRSSALHKHHQVLQQLFDSLPDIARRQFLLETMLSEMQNTIEIDSGPVARVDLVNGLRATLDPTVRARRFSGLAQAYSRLAHGDCDDVRTLHDIRALHDELSESERGGRAARAAQPAGELFRKEGVPIVRKSGSGKVIHQGVTPESEIFRLLESLLYLMNDDNLPNLVKIAIFHYYFSYVHPFYSGNGRVARFIASCMLGRELGPASSLVLARASCMNAMKYAELFEITNSARNRGELNAFIEGFMALVNAGQKDLILELQQKTAALAELEERIARIASIAFTGSRAAADVLRQLAQHDLFTDDDSGLTLAEFHALIQPAAISRQSLRLTLGELEGKGLVKSVGVKPKRYFVNMAFFSR